MPSKSRGESSSNLEKSSDHSPNEDSNGYLDKKSGMGWVVTGLFVAGELAGAGMIALPLSVRALGFYFGNAFLLLSGCMAAYTSIILGRSWLIVQKHWPEYRHHCRDPYAQIGFRSYGVWMKRLVEISVNLGMFGMAVIFVVVSSKNVNDAVKQFAALKLDYCFAAVIITMIITPFTMLKSPKDFWWAMMLSIGCTIAAVILAFCGATSDLRTCDDTLTVPHFEYTAAFTSLGNVMLAYGGHACFPTIQNDMRQPQKFGLASILAYFIITMLYSPISLVANLAYNANLAPSVINNLQIEWIQESVNILITVHCITTVILVMNPVMQTVEEIMGAPDDFGFHRIVIRSGMMLLLLIVVETFPEFAPLMGLVGGFAFSTTSFLFPVLFYLQLNVLDQKMVRIENIRAREEESESSSGKTMVICKFGLVESLSMTSWPHLIAIGGIFVISFFIMIVATLFAINDLATASFKMPCYLRWIKDWEDEGDVVDVTPVYCCGKFSNITLEPQCIKKNFY
ncbi:unnamed protein product [Bursaphelenchus xylophilus]|uniref:(pine wood nematode) hypothetical protein n=1 Tax=Bursaphelenchus xylophilus TaxID=6326 RepID=A0A1I7SX95_BURXY|nr:unnamed protein product [Bursaphelenchus xylophilus]CAG9100268.1 unnamed protein product [Bursaphelenchus xylophilus]